MEQKRKIKMRLMVHKVPGNISNQDLKKLLREHLKNSDFPYEFTLGHPYTKGVPRK